MSYICGGNSATRQDAGHRPVDLHRQGGPRGSAGVGGGSRVVPDLYRRTVDAAAVAALFPLLYAAALWLYRGDRKAGQR